MEGEVKGERIKEKQVGMVEIKDWRGGKGKKRNNERTGRERKRANK